MSDHEPGVEAAVLHEERGEGREGGVHQAFNTTLGNGGELVDADGEVVESLGGLAGALMPHMGIDEPLIQDS